MQRLGALEGLTVLDLTRQINAGLLVFCFIRTLIIQNSGLYTEMYSI